MVTAYRLAMSSGPSPRAAARDEQRAGQQHGGAERGGLFFFVRAAGPEGYAVELADFGEFVLEQDVRDLVCDVARYSASGA